jgi:uncharacterized protein YjbK
MSLHREIEIKWELTAVAYSALDLHLCERFGHPRVLEQSNRFFDCDGVLRRNRMNLRLRRENEKLLMTCKRRSPTHRGNVHDHDEWEEWLEPSMWQRLGETVSPAELPLPDEVRAVIGTMSLRLVGGFSNHRREFDADAELVCLDRTDFNGKRIDHELEIETARADATAAAWTRQLADWKISAKPQLESKFSRMLALYGPGTL